MCLQIADISAHRALTSLDVSNNSMFGDIDDEGPVQVVADALEFSSMLVTFSIANNSMKPQQIKKN